MRWCLFKYIYINIYLWRRSKRMCLNTYFKLWFVIVIWSPCLTGNRVEKIPEWAVGVELGRPPSLGSVWLAVLVNQQVWCGSTSVRGDRHKETRERGRLQWARWPSAWDWRIDLSPKSNLEDGRNPRLMIAGRVSWRHWCDKEDGGAVAHWALCAVWQIVGYF